MSKNKITKIKVGNVELRKGYCTTHKYNFVNKEADENRPFSKDVFNSDLGITELKIIDLINKCYEFGIYQGTDATEYILKIETETIIYTIFVTQNKKGVA